MEMDDAREIEAQFRARNENDMNSDDEIATSSANVLSPVQKLSQKIDFEACFLPSTKEPLSCFRVLLS
jgi:hypothetical protein